MTSAPTRVDRYPTRLAQRVELLPRTDPVVWGGPADGPLNPAALGRYEENGFHLEPELLTAEEVRVCRREMRRLAEDPALRSDDRLVREEGAGEIRSIFEVHRLSPAIARLLASDKVVDRARQILGSEVYLHQSRLNYKPGFGGGPFYWHSDFETWHAEDGLPAPRAFSFSIALSENAVHNGGLMIMPGSHQTFVTCLGATPDEHFRQSLSGHGPQIGMPDRDSITTLADRHGIHLCLGPAGSATMFDANCMHGSNGNITPYARSNLFVVFNSVENTPEEPFAAANRRPPFIAAREFTPVGRL
ncbi:ectoine hydroxylase [Crossiella equi]|uniref:Ectoine hydroxylase n=1 Tax=Crossiella equi TaxID=130796 RepID=A0ABS5A5S8_9PSEU|nr:ectoine hydroxylase [Crossiella equi]MBP2471587.1 ectoine hydroxylase [Crossiella equi]